MKQVTARFKASLALKFTIIAAVMLVFVGMYIYDGFRFTRHIKGEALLIEKAGNLRFRSFEMAWWLRRIVVEQEAARKKTHIKHLLLEAGRFDEIAAYLLTTFEAKDKKQYGETAKELDKLVDRWNNGLKQLVVSIPESSGYNQKLLMDRYEAIIHPYVDEVDLLVKTHALHMEKELDAYGSRRAVSLAVLAGIFILSISFVVKGLIVPIHRLREAAAKITGEGPDIDIDIDIDIDRRDELGALAVSFRKMIQRLNEAFAKLRKDKDTLSASEARLTDAQKIARLGDFERDILNGTLYWSEELYHIFGLKADESPVTFQAFLDVIHPEDLDFFRKTIEEAINGKKPFDLDYRIILPEGSERFVNVQGEAVFDDSGRAIKTRGTVQDITERKQAESELIDKNALILTLIESIPDMFYHKDIQGRYVIVNGIFAEFAGLSKEEVTGKAPEELFSTETAKAARESDEVVLMTVNPLRFEYPTVDRQGHKMVLDIIKTPVLAGSGEVIGMLGIFRDITEKKKIEDTIKSSRDFYLELFNKFPQPFRRTDSYGRCNYVNRAWLKRTGQEFEESLSYGWVAALHTEDREATMNEFLIAFNVRQPVVLTYRISSRDGQYRWIIEYGTPFNGPDGKFAGYICSCHDFTERKKIEEALAQSENRFKQFFEQNEIAIMLLDPLDCAICEANHAAARLYGYTREELIEKGLALLISPVLLDGFKEVVRSSILSQGAEGFSLLPQFHTRKDGSSAIVVVHAKSIRLSPEGMPVLYCSFFDITATIRLQEEGKVRQAQLIHSNKMASVGLMISGIVHEINNPNAFIMSNAQLMQDISQEVLQLLERLYKAQPDISIAGLSFPEIREAAPRLVSGIIDASFRINEIVRNIGDFVRPESEDMEKKFDINSAILTSTAILTNQIKKCTDNFHLDLNKGLPLIRGSSQKLEQVIINLVMNSLQALPDRGRGVYVSTARDEDADCVIIEIRDEGRGMQEENMNRIKEPFFTTKSEAGGTGLGLFISDEIIRKHNGSLCFESEQEKGTTAIIRLPIEAEL